MRPPIHPLARALLTVPAWLYGGAIRLRNRRYDRPGATRRASRPVISVGNLTVGGTGKTPMVAWLARQLRDDGRQPAVVSRGYGGRAGKGPLVVSAGDGPRCGPSECGDEPYLLALRLANVIVVVGSDRAAGAESAAALGARVILLDDGFQHRRLARDLDIVLLDARSPFDGGRLLPAGLLREPPAALGRADVVIITRSGPRDSHPSLERAIRRYAARATILRAGHRRAGYVDSAGRTVGRPRRVLAFCGIAQPELFLADLREDGLELAATRLFADHHRYSPAELAELLRSARDHEARAVTTEKDLARLAPLLQDAERSDLLALRIEAQIHDPAPLLRAVQVAVGATS